MRHHSSGARPGKLPPGRALVAASMLVAGVPAGAQDMRLNMTRGATELSRQVFDLHMTIFYICVAIALVVFGLMFWSIVRHRKARGAVPAQFHGSLKVEILWTAIPVLILVAMAVPATRTLIAMEDTSASELTVLVTGSQWKWHYKYLDYPIEFYSVLATPRAQIANARMNDMHEVWAHPQLHARGRFAEVGTSAGRVVPSIEPPRSIAPPLAATATVRPATVRAASVPDRIGSAAAPTGTARARAATTGEPDSSTMPARVSIW